MKYAWLALNWIFGVLFLLLGIVSAIDDPLSAPPLFIAALLLLPPVRSFIYSKTQKEFPFKARAISIFVLLIVFGIFAGQSQERKAQELEVQKAQERAQKLAQIKEKNINYFNENRVKILSDVKLAITSKEYRKAISLSSEYLPSGDPELSKFHQQAKLALTELEKAKKTKKILAELRTIPARKYEKNRSLYQQLTTLHPNNQKYKSKLNYYQAKVAEEKKKERLAAERKKRIERQFSAWDGSHRNLERIIKKTMNDPDSYDHVETVFWDMGKYLIVKTTFRGKNAFGGVVVNWVKAKVDLDGNIIGIMETYP